MKVVKAPRELHALVTGWRAAGHRVGLVPTMGALHEGHLSLVRAARRESERVAVSIFINPLQFDQEADLVRYPRQEEGDLALLEAAGVDVAWLPGPADMYPEGHQTRVEPGPVAESLEGACRPGHFAGVCTVVLKLLHAAWPHRAWFGAKDAQQLAVVRRMVTDLDLPVAIEAVPTVRDPDGLALSSRNRFLDPGERRRALSLSRGLFAAREAHRSGERRAAAILDRARAAFGEAQPPVEPEYLELRHPLTFAPVGDPVASALILVAARVGATRLIDNLPLGEEAEAYMGGSPPAPGEG